MEGTKFHNIMAIFLVQISGSLRWVQINFWCYWVILYKEFNILFFSQYIQIICWAPQNLQAQSTGLHSISLEHILDELLLFLLQLVLRDNDLVELPKALGNLTRLKELHLQNNRLTALPPELGEFMTLHTNYFSFSSQQ